MKTVILLIGTSASGKSTLRELLVPVPLKTENRITQSLKKNNWCYVGNGKAGSETIRTLPEFEVCLLDALYRCEYVVVDTVRISDNWPSLIKKCSKKRSFKLVLVHLDYPYSVLQKRLLERRAKLGLSDKDPKRAISQQGVYRLSTLRAVEAFCKSFISFKRIHITQELSPEEIVSRVIDSVGEC